MRKNIRNKSEFFSDFYFLKGYLKNHKRSFVLFFSGWFIEAILTLALPLLFGVLIDEMVYYKNLDTFMKIILLIVVLSIFWCSLYFVIYAFYNQIVGRYGFDLKMDLFNHLLSLETESFEMEKSGDVINSLQSYTRESILIITRNVVYTFYCLFLILFYSSYIFLINWHIGSLVLLFVVISTIVTLKSTKKIRIYSDKHKALYGKYVGWLFEVLNNIRDIRLLVAENSVDRVFSDKNKEILDLNIKKSIYSLTLNNIVDFINMCMQMTIFGVGAYYAIKGEITIGLLIVIIAFFSDLKQNMIWLNGYYVDLQDRMAYVKYIRNFKELPTEKCEGEQELKVTRGEIVFNNVSFAYRNGKNVIDDLSLKITENDRIAIVGKSGCGKTTLVSMLVGFIRPQNGLIEIDGQDLSKCSLKSIRREIGIVQQNSLVFDGTIGENVELGNRKASKEQILDACKKAGIIDFINTLDNGLNTVIGSKGVGLSGGQKQRIAIARIYLKDPKIIIFDESTSSLDDETAKIIHSSWNEVSKNKTVIVISHKKSSVFQCKQISIMENGKIANMGYLDKISKESEYFKNLFSIQ